MGNIGRLGDCALPGGQTLRRRSQSMIVGVSPALASLLCALALAGCADETIRLTYTPPAPSQSLGPRLVIGSFRDVRGNEVTMATPTASGASMADTATAWRR